MAGNSRRKGALRKPGTKKGAVVGSGGQKSKGLRGRGATPPAEIRTGHPAQRRVARAGSPARARRRPDTEAGETVFGRNAVVECLRAGVPATALQVAIGVDADDRISESVQRAADVGLAILEVPRADLDRLAAGALHQGVALQVPPYQYAHPDDVLSAARGSGVPPLLVALDGVTDPRNLGAVVRSAAAFGAHGLLLPQRRSAGITAVAWRTSAGTAARLPVAR
ncbi:MAG: TrmH family RNA methyltransferase, partial [Pseudonocardiaceae bacterium]